MANVTWIFKEGMQRHSCSSFPFAFRAMYHACRRDLAKGKLLAELVKGYSIISPLNKVYSYSRAVELATQQGLLLSDGSLNDKEFKRKR